MNAQASPVDAIASTAMLRMVAGFGVGHAVRIAAELGVADLIAAVPRTAQELAALTRTEPSSLERVLRVLASVGALTVDDRGRFTLTSVGATLQSDVPGSLRAWTLSVLGPESRTAWDNLMHSVQSGGIAFDDAFGTNVWNYRAMHAESARVFDAAMGDLIAVYNVSVPEAYDFSCFEKIVDVGGGNGSFMMTLLQSSAGIRGVVCDMPHVADKARQRLADAGLTDRCEVVAGDILEAVPAGGDAYVLSRVIHDWNDERALVILRNCRKVMTANARLLAIDRVLPDCMGAAGSSAAMFVSDLQMMVMNGGRERTAAEWRALLAAAGFELHRIVPTDSVMQVLESRPI